MRSLPLVIGITSAWLPPVALALFLLTMGLPFPEAITMRGGVFLAGGMLYTHLFIYFYHRYPMHHYYRRIPGAEGIKDAHTEHHRAFPGSRLRISPEELTKPFKMMGGRTVQMNDMISQRWWIPISLVSLHMATVALCAEPVHVLMWGIGLVVHYTIYDVSHWFTHVRPTRFSTFLESLPGIGNLWKLTMQIHDVHHSDVNLDFNFTPPWLGDMLGGTFATRPPEHTKPHVKPT